MKPIRIQRKRTKGWKMPPNTVYVGRPSKWGNPFSIIYDEDIPDMETLLRYYKCYIMDKIETNSNFDILELKGKDLACWCKIGEPCHADILLKLANK